MGIRVSFPDADTLSCHHTVDKMPPPSPSSAHIKRSDARRPRNKVAMIYQYLDGISSPADLRTIPQRAMPSLASEIRDFLVSNVAETGGHLASNLGVVELSVALHRVFDTPNDHVIWDVGHQSYVHKILTGRRGRFSELRTPGGLSGFTRRSESEYDPFGAGHSSTSISAALGFARADALAGRSDFTVAVIGDGAYTGGMVHEALNNCAKDLRLIIVLNENEMSISRNTGAFAHYMSRIRSSRSYNRVKRNTTSVLMHIPLIGKPIFRMIRAVKKGFKNLIFHSNYFEELGLFYIGPIDGNDYFATERALRAAKEKGEPVVVHLRTVKGKGYTPAEKDPSGYHSVSSGKPQGATFGRVFGEHLSGFAREDARVAAITAAMGIGTGLEEFSVAHPKKYFDVGIAEEHALTFSAGLAAEGMRPYAAIYSTFLQRAYDNILHDIALQSLPVHIMIDRAGLAMADGATHHGIFDVAFLSHIPGMRIYAPATFGSLRAIMDATRESDGPVAIRYPNKGEDPAVVSAFYPNCEYSEFGVRSDGCEKPDAILITYGSIVSEALRAKELLSADGKALRILLLEELKPYDKIAERLLPHLSEDVPILFLEEGILDGGASMILAERLIDAGFGFSSGRRILAIRDHFAAPDSPVDLLQYCGIGAENIREAALTLLREKSSAEGAH